MDKELLLKDLSGRLTYGVKFFAYKVLSSDNVIYYDSEKLVGIVADSVISEKESFDINQVRPYLRLMSSMTEEEKKEYFGRTMAIGIARTSKEIIDWLNAHHFDYRGLIERGLAIEAPDGMYNSKEQ